MPSYMLVADAENPKPWAPLIQLEEFSPGAQLVDVADPPAWDFPLKNEIPGGRYLVFNCELFIPCPPGAVDLDPALTTPQTSYELFVQSLQVQYKTTIRAVTLIRPPSQRSTLITSTISTAGERFWRVSAYANDRRITTDRQIVAGTYVTTDSDIDFIASGLAAVGRYALPNPFPSIHAFSVMPQPGTHIELGTVRPLYGQAGGGVEGIFRTSTGPWTVSNHVRVLPAW